MNKQDIAQALLKISHTPCHNEWQRHRYNLTRDFLQRDPEDFMDFQAIKETMFVGNAEYTFEQYKEMRDAITLDSIMDRDIFSQNHQHPAYATTGNTIHHRYHLFMLDKLCACKAEDCNSILELGGGYGNMARIIWKMGFTGEYSIVDLPEFIVLQDYYLSHHGILVNWQADLARHYDLFIATWSLSEIPLEDRAPYEKLDVDYFLLAYGPNYAEIKNHDYFQHFVSCYPDHSFVLLEAPHQTDQYYLVGEPK